VNAEDALEKSQANIIPGIHEAEAMKMIPLDSEGMRRVKAMAARAHKQYASIKAKCEAAVVRWRWATFSMHSYEPAYFEINKFTRGKWFAEEPEAKENVYAYGYDAEGRVVVLREYSSFPGEYSETFYRHEPKGIMAITFERDPEKNWERVEWFSLHDGDVVANDSIASTQNTQSGRYQYNDKGQMVRADFRCINPPSLDIADSRDLEYDEKGKISRIYWNTYDGLRVLDFSRPTHKMTLKALKPQLLEGLTAAVIKAIKRLKIKDEVYVIALRYISACYEQLLPPVVGINTVSERTRLFKEHREYPFDAIWNPAEWKWGELDLQLSPELQAACTAANQDIWQNERENEALRLYAEVANRLQPTDLPLQTSDDYVAVVVMTEPGDYAGQVSQNLRAPYRKKLQKAGWLPV
jgi:hypothetical protein